MNISKQAFAFIISILISTAAVAHSNHGPRGPITQNQAEAKVEFAIKRLINQKKLDSTWGGAQRISVMPQVKAQGKIWVIQYTNSALSAAGSKSLYIVLDDMGNTLSATHSEP